MHLTSKNKQVLEAFVVTNRKIAVCNGDDKETQSNISLIKHLNGKKYLILLKN